MLPKECKAFQQYFDDIQQALESIAGMDDLLAGIHLYIMQHSLPIVYTVCLV